MIQLDARLIRQTQAANPCSQVDVRRRTKILEFFFDPWILLERVNESADGVKRGQIHLLCELLETPWREPRCDPGSVVGELKFRSADEKIVRPETVEGSKPRVSGCQVAPESVDVGRLRRHDAPPKYAEPHRSHPSKD